MLALGGVQLGAATALAPMAALTDSLFRRLVKRQGGCGLLVSEMVSARALLSGCRRSRQLLEFSPEERPIAAQLAGAEPETMARAAERVEQLGFDLVDVNMGCPARKVTAGGGGAALMREPRRVERLLRAMRRSTKLPISVKLRAGWSEQCLNAAEIARIAEDCGAVLVTVHARSRKDGYRPGLREEILVRTREAVDIAVFANGDVRSSADARRLLRRTGCDGVMVGRGVVANPWLFRELAGHSSAGRPSGWILDHFALLMENPDRRWVLHKLRTFAGWYTRGLISGDTLRRRISQLENPEQFMRVVSEFLDAQPETAAPAGFALASQEGRP